MIYFILVLLFIAVFAYIGWRIIAGQQTTRSDTTPYVCPHCDEINCECHKRDDLK